MPPRPLVLLVAVVAIGYAYGFLTSLIPSPSDPEVFWVSNLAAPYAVLPFLAGAVLAGAGTAGAAPAGAAPAGGGRAGRAVASVTAGALLGAGLVAGFYRFHAVGRDPQADIGVPETLAGAYLRWLSTFVLGRPGGIPWLTLAVVVGALAAGVGWLWAARGAGAAGLLGVSPLLCEPLVHALAVPGIPLVRGYPAVPQNLAVWAAEALLGVVALWWVLRRASSRQPAHVRSTPA